MYESPFITGAKVRALRKKLGHSAQTCAEMVGLNNGSGWRRWEREGAKGTAAVLLLAMIDLPALRQHLAPADE